MKDYFEIDLSDIKATKAYDIDDIPWVISRYVFESEGGYVLREGDLLKLGKFILKIRQIRLKSEQKTMVVEKGTKEEDSRNILRTESMKREVLLLSKGTGEKGMDRPTCRICLGDEHDDANPLINPCKCAGTMKYIHLECLRQLIESKIQRTKGEPVTVINFKTLECDICKSLIPENIKLKNKVYTIIDLNRPDSNYIIIEGLVKETPDVKSIFVINLNSGRPIKIGRSSEADLRLSDISVSRSHATISLYDGNCILNDTRSKFGTLLNAGTKLMVIPAKPLSIQRGNILVKFSLSMKLCSLLACYKPKKVPFRNYNLFFAGAKGARCQIKDVPNFLWTDTQIVSEYEDNSQISMIKKSSENVESNKNLIDSRNLTGDVTNITVLQKEKF